MTKNKLNESEGPQVSYERQVEKIMEDFVSEKAKARACLLYTSDAADE